MLSCHAVYKDWLTGHATRRTEGDSTRPTHLRRRLRGCPGPAAPAAAPSSCGAGTETRRWGVSPGVALCWNTRSSQGEHAEAVEPLGVSRLLQYVVAAAEWGVDGVGAR